MKRKASSFLWLMRVFFFFGRGAGKVRGKYSDLIRPQKVAEKKKSPYVSIIAGRRDPVSRRPFGIVVLVCFLRTLNFLIVFGIAGHQLLASCLRTRRSASGWIGWQPMLSCLGRERFILTHPTWGKISSRWSCLGAWVVLRTRTAILPGWHSWYLKRRTWPRRCSLSPPFTRMAARHRCLFGGHMTKTATLFLTFLQEDWAKKAQAKQKQKDKEKKATMNIYRTFRKHICGNHNENQVHFVFVFSHHGLLFACLQPKKLPLPAMQLRRGHMIRTPKRIWGNPYMSNEKRPACLWYI